MWLQDRTLIFAYAGECERRSALRRGGLGASDGGTRWLGIDVAGTWPTERLVKNDSRPLYSDPCGFVASIEETLCVRILPT